MNACFPVSHPKRFLKSKPMKGTTLFHEPGKAPLAPRCSASWSLPNKLSTQLSALDLSAAIQRYKTEAPWQQGKQEGHTLLATDSLRIVLMGLRANAMLKAVEADCRQHIQVLEGRISFISDQQQMILEQAQSLGLQARAAHHMVALDDSFYLLILMLDAVPRQRRVLTKIDL
jgi:quercetin dioxygenase-like cupin family protein